MEDFRGKDGKPELEYSIILPKEKGQGTLGQRI